MYVQVICYGYNSVLTAVLKLLNVIFYLYFSILTTLLWHISKHGSVGQVLKYGWLNSLNPHRSSVGVVCVSVMY